jgi:cyclophilin family peptidyl-prolyl cis-trans isomerase/HEAT repeat protein
VVRVPFVAASLVLISAHAMAQGPAVSSDQVAYLATALDRWSIDLPIAVTMLEEPSPAVRARAVQVLASSADPARIPLLAGYLADPAPAVRQQVMLAAGREGIGGLDLAVRGLSDSSPQVRQAAAWALCGAGAAGWEPLARLLANEQHGAVLETALANAWRLEGAPWQASVARFADNGSPYLRRAAAYSLARTDDPGARAALRKLATDEEPVIRTTAMRGFARGELTSVDLETVVSALDDPDWRVQAAACGVLAAADAVPLPAAAARTVASFFASQHPQLAWTALAVAVAQPVIGTTADLTAALNGADPWLAAEALTALAARDAKAAAKTAGEWAAATSPDWQRRAAARVAVKLGPEAEQRAAADPDAGVRLAWLSSLDADQAAARNDTLRSLLATDPDPAVRAQILSLLREADAAPSVEGLIALHTAWKGDTMPDARVEALVAAMAATEPGPQRQAILAIGLADTDPAAVAMVVNGARGLGETVAFPAREPRHGARWYQDLIAWTAEPRWLDVVTDRGTFRISLDLDAAPLTSREIWDLAAAGFYDGLDFHRVVPNFVVQGGDPRGDGWGGPGFVLPDEPSLVPFDSWRVGIATSGPQTGGCQLFVTLTPADHLTGHYTNIGEVVEGREVLTAIRVGDRIREVRALTGEVGAAQEPRGRGTVTAPPTAAEAPHTAPAAAGRP